jgi:hypothetical protein
MALRFNRYGITARIIKEGAGRLNRESPDRPDGPALFPIAIINVGGESWA